MEAVDRRDRAELPPSTSSKSRPPARENWKLWTTASTRAAALGCLHEQSRVASGNARGFSQRQCNSRTSAARRRPRARAAELRPLWRRRCSSQVSSSELPQCGRPLDWARARRVPVAVDHSEDTARGYRCGGPAGVAARVTQPAPTHATETVNERFPSQGSRRARCAGRVVTALLVFVCPRAWS